jgi:hypothetical protein
MARWGDGIYESDGASDWAVETCQNLLAEAAAIINAEDLALIDFDCAFAPIDVVCYLCERADAVPFEDPDILNWRGRVLAVFEAETHELGWSAEEAAERRDGIDRLFDRLEAIVESSGAPERWDPKPGSMWHRLREQEQQFRDCPPENLRPWHELADACLIDPPPTRRWWQFWRRG